MQAKNPPPAANVIAQVTGSTSWNFPYYPICSRRHWQTSVGSVGVSVCFGALEVMVLESLSKPVACRGSTDVACEL